MCGWWRSEVPPIFLMNPLQCQTLPCCYFMLPPPYLSMSRLQASGSCLGTRHLVISCCCLLLCAGVGCLYLAITIKLKLLMFGVQCKIVWPLQCNICHRNVCSGNTSAACSAPWYFQETFTHTSCFYSTLHLPPPATLLKLGCLVFVR